MCRNIKPLYHFDPPATDDEIRAAALQFVRKVSGFTKPSQANQGAFDQAVDEVTAAVQTLFGEPHHHRPPARPRGRGRQGPRPIAPPLWRPPTH